MIEIIEHGQEKFEAVCHRCGCRFTYQLEDLTYASTEYVDCPDCGQKYYHIRQTRTVPSVSGGDSMAMGPDGYSSHPQYAGTALLKEQPGPSCDIVSMSKEEFEEKLRKASESIYNEALHYRGSPAQEIIDKIKEGKLPPLTDNPDFGIDTLK